MASSSSANKVRKRIFFVVINLISLLCLAWTLRLAHLGELRQEVAHLDWRWVTLGMILELLIYVCQAWRWQLVLMPLKTIPIWDYVRSVYVGLFASAIFPLRAGEIIRCYLLAKWGEIPVSVSLASALIERIFDGVWLVFCVFVTAHYVHLPRQFVAGEYFLVALVGICSVLIGIAMFWKQQTLDYILGAKWLGWVHVLIEDLHLIGHSRYLYYAAFVSLPCILIQTLPIYALIRAYSHLSYLSFFAAFALMVVLRLGTVIPQAPGNLGMYNVVTVIALHRLFGVPADLAGRFSLVLLAGTTLPVLLVGFIAIAITGVKMGEVHQSAKDHMRRKHPQRVDETPVS